MADRFPDCDAKELQQFKENAENSLDRHLKETGSNISIAEDREFVNSCKVLEGKARFLHEQGCKSKS